MTKSKIIICMLFVLSLCACGNVSSVSTEAPTQTTEIPVEEVPLTNTIEIPDIWYTNVSAALPGLEIHMHYPKDDGIPLNITDAEVCLDPRDGRLSKDPFSLPWGPNRLHVSDGEIFFWGDYFTPAAETLSKLDAIHTDVYFLDAEGNVPAYAVLQIYQCEHGYGGKVTDTVLLSRSVSREKAEQLVLKRHTEAMQERGFDYDETLPERPVTETIFTNSIEIPDIWYTNVSTALPGLEIHMHYPKDDGIPLNITDAEVCLDPRDGRLSKDPSTLPQGSNRLHVSDGEIFFWGDYFTPAAETLSKLDAIHADIYFLDIKGNVSAYAVLQIYQCEHGYGGKVTDTVLLSRSVSREEAEQLVLKRHTEAMQERGFDYNETQPEVPQMDPARTP